MSKIIDLNNYKEESERRCFRKIKLILIDKNQQPACETDPKIISTTAILKIENDTDKIISLFMENYKTPYDEEYFYFKELLAYCRERGYDIISDVEDIYKKPLTDFAIYTVENGSIYLLDFDGIAFWN